MVQHNISRRHFLGASALGVMGGASLVHPVQAAAEAVGVKPGDLPDLTIKEVKTYVANIEGVRKFNSPENGWIFSMVTNSGIEGNYTDGNRGLSCTFCSISHLREAMPFDQIEVVMGLRGLYECGLELAFDFYKVNEGALGGKLATGQYQALWVDTQSNTIENLPCDYARGLTQFVSEAAE